MVDRREQLKELLTKLEQQRDEIRVKMHLAKAEARDEWNDLEQKFERLKGRLGVMGEEADDAMEDINAAAGMLADELKKGYERIRKLI